MCRVSTGNGHPPPFLQHNDTKCKDTIKDTLAPELLTFFELQKFSNRLHTAMSAQISANNGVPETIVKMWEAEFELLRPLVTRVETGRLPVTPLLSMSLLKKNSFQTSLVL